LDEGEIEQFLRYIDKHSTMPVRDRLIIMLSFRAGLRVSEIAKIDISAMTDASGRVAKVISIHSHVGKKKRSREVPMNPLIAEALTEFRKVFKGATFVAISSQPFRFKPKGAPYDPKLFKRMSIHALTVYYHWLLEQAGFEGASSHSGRRTFGTELARSANNFHNSLKDVQEIMGHARLDTTERYIAPSKNRYDMVASLGAKIPA
jgi:integrase/recombinase XerD